MKLTRSLLAVAACALPLGAEILAVVEKKAGMVAFYDTAGGKRVSEVKVGSFPHELAYSPDRSKLYVTDNGLLWMTDKGEGYNTISIIDVKSRSKAGVIDLGNYRRPHGMIVNPKTGHLVVTIENPFGLLAVDPVAKKVIRKYEVNGTSPHMVMFGPGYETAWASNAGSGNVAVVNLKSGAVEKLIKTGENPQGAVMTRDGKRVYLTNSRSNTIAVIDTAKREVIGEIKTGELPARIALTPDEKTLVYNLQVGEGVAFADVATLKETARAKLPGRPLSLSLSKDGLRAYLGVQDSDKIAIASVPERKVIQIIDTPKNAGPDTIVPVP